MTTRNGPFMTSKYLHIGHNPPEGFVPVLRVEDDSFELYGDTTFFSPIHATPDECRGHGYLHSALTGACGVEQRSNLCLSLLEGGHFRFDLPDLEVIVTLDELRVTTGGRSVCMAGPTTYDRAIILHRILGAYMYEYFGVGPHNLVIRPDHPEEGEITC